MKNKFFGILIFVIAFFVLINLAQAGTITANVSETNINSTVLLTGTGFSADTIYYLIPLLENKSAWWDGFNENWFFYQTSTNVTINVTTNSTGGFTYALYIPNDWRVSGGKVSFKIGKQVASSLLWSTQGSNWIATQPTKNGITGDSSADGFVYTASNVGGVSQGGIEKFYKSNGTRACFFNYSVASNINDITNNGTILYGVTSGGSILRINAGTCASIGSTSTIAQIAYSVNIAPNNQYIIITYPSGLGPYMYNTTVDPPS